MSYADLLYRLVMLTDQIARVEDTDRSAGLEKLVKELESQIRELKGEDYV